MKSSDLDKLINVLIHHVKHNIGLDIDSIPEHLINKLPYYVEDKSDIMIYRAGNIEGKCWTLCPETADAFSCNGNIPLHVRNLKDVETPYISLDVLSEFINYHILDTFQSEMMQEYVSESEIYLFN